MQLACIFNNLETQEWQDLDKNFIVMQKKLPKKNLPASGENASNQKKKTCSFQSAARQKLAEKGQKSNP